MIHILHYRLGGKCFTKDFSVDLSNHGVFLCIAEQLPRYSILATQLLYRTSNF